MIEHLSGVVLKRLPHSIILDVNGVGYGLEMPLSALCDAPAPGERLQLWVDTYVREDVLKLFGFTTFEDRQAFIMLRSVSGIGPKIALAVLSTLDGPQLRSTILQNRLQVLESIPGIGRRTAERMVLELKVKMEKMSFATPGIADKSNIKGARAAASAKSTGEDFDIETQSGDRMDQLMLDLRSALENLGYKDKEIGPVISNVMKYHQADEGDGHKVELDFQAMLRTALKSMRTSV